MPEKVIYCREVEVHFACKVRLELFNFQLDHHEASQLQIVEEEIKVIILFCNLEMVLAPYECEAFAEFEKERPQVIEQAALQFLLGDVRAKT
jgi:hypothetical protein